MLFAGERLLHGSVFLIIASILKYAALTLATYEMPELARSASQTLGDVFGLLAAPLHAGSGAGSMKSSST